MMMSRQRIDPEDEDETEDDRDDAVDDRNQDADFPDYELPVGIQNNVE